MIIGITGSRVGGSPEQLERLESVLRENPLPHVLHHGDCVGVDAQAHDIAMELGYYVVVHPPLDPSRRAWCAGDEMRPARPFLERNHNIVNECDTLIALPDKPETLRSGTWATIRYARKRATPAVILA